MARKMPLDIPAVIKEAIGVTKARQEPISISVYLDDAAPGDLIAYVRSSFASAEAHARITMLYLNSAHAVPDPDDNIAVVAAGVSDKVGTLAAQLRANGVPTMVVTTMPTLVNELAKLNGCPIPEGDVIAPSAEAGNEPIELTDASRAELDRKMGEWICATMSDKRFSFAMAFPFVRKPLALDSVNKTALENAGVGVVVFIPGADMPVMTLNQAKMVLQIAGAYGQPITVDRAKELIAVVAGGFAMRSVARQLVAFVPGIGFVIKGAIGYAATLAMGRATIEYFENGGGIVGLGKMLGDAADSIAKTARKTAGQEAARNSEPSQEVTQASSAQDWMKRLSGAAQTIGTVAQPFAEEAIKIGAESFKDGIKAFLKK